jgi:2-methylcitrate dehydratase PrpD
VAILSGYEAAARLFSAYRLRYPLHPHGHFGAVGAAIAVAMLRHAPAGPPARIAATLPLLSVWTPCFEGATARNAYSGTAASIGIVANHMAASGFTGSRDALHIAFTELAGELVDPDALTGALDPTGLSIHRDYMKFYSACALTHTAIEAVLELGSLPVEDIVRIEVETVSNNMKLDCTAEENNLSTRFSLPYAVAATIIHGHAGPEAFTPDPRAFALAELVEMRVSPDLDAAWPEASGSRVTVHAGGEALTAHVDNPLGHYANPPTPEQLEEKFEALVGPSNEGSKRYDYGRLLAIADVEDVATLFESPAP